MRFVRTGSAKVARAGHSATLLVSGEVLIAGGASGALGASAEVFDPATGELTLVGSMNEKRSDHVAVRLADGRVLLAGGGMVLPDPAAGIEALMSRPEGRCASAEIFDPRTRTFMPVAAMARGREAAAGIQLADGTVLVTGGMDEDTLAESERFDPATGSWRDTDWMAVARYRPVLASLPNGHVIVAGGGPLPETRASERFNPALGDGSWIPAGEATAANAYAAAACWASGHILLAGGTHYPRDPDKGDEPRFQVVGGTGMATPPEAMPTEYAVAASELYDPATETWTAAGDLPEPRTHAEGIVLADGRALVTGGTRDAPVLVFTATGPDFARMSPAPSSATWLFALETRRFVEGPSMLVPRVHHTITRLLDGSLLVVGGRIEAGRQDPTDVCERLVLE